MPVYDYFCQACGSQFERRLSFLDDKETSNCPVCGAGAFRKFAVPAVIFKGSGFYQTDHRPKSKSDSARSQA